MQVGLEKLQEKIRILEAENQRLSERAEETLLLSLVAENLNHANNRVDVLENVLEKISILKSIPYCACYSIHEHSLKLLCTYAIFSDDTSPKIQITLSPEIFKELNQGPYIVDVDSEEAKGIAISFQDLEFTPKTVAIFPFETRSISREIFAFIDDDPTGDRLSPMSMLLQQIADMTCARLDNLSLLSELKQINTELDRRVEERTKELIRTNKRLQTEIKERRRSEEALMESEKRFRTAFQTSPDSININRLADGLFIDINDGFTALTGYTRNDVTGRTSLDINIWDDPEDRNKFVAGLKKDGQVNNLEAKFRLKDGNVKTGLISAKVIMLDKVPHTLSITRDISRLKMAEEERLRLATAVEQAAESIIITDKKGIIKYVNPAFLKTIGYAQHKVIGQDFRLLKSDRHNNAFYKQIWNTISSGRIWSGHITNKAKDGTIREFETTISPIRDSSDNIVNFVSVNRDVTQEVALEKKLRQAQKMESVGTLAGGIAHDFNNILSAIIGYAELTIADTAESAGVRKNLEEIFKAGQRAKDLVRQILAFSRQSEQELKPVQISHIVREALKLLRASLPSTIEIRQNIQPQVENIMADSTQIHQVLMNLCTNSAHAMQESGGVLEINLSSEELDSDFTIHHPGLCPGRYLKLTVADTGCGIPPEFLDRIFDPYFTTKDKDQGTGLGLAVVHGIAKSHGGTITVESEPAKGSIFNLYLPTIESEADSGVDIQKASPTGNERILFVDDEKALADMCKLMMESLGYEVETRTSSIEALELFRAKPDHFHLVITDMTMPHMTGDKLATEILHIRPNIPIIISTGFSEKITEKKAKALGIKALVMKPVIRDNLAVIIRKVIDES
jgi:PAS domain S-box-containing protein